MRAPRLEWSVLMPNIVVAGAQWGDEGKGKVVDLLTEKVQVVARFNGGHNAGHTIKVGKEQFVLHLIPAGVLHPGILCVMGNGMVIDPWALEKELAELSARGVAVDDNVVLSDRAHLILPHHYALEAMAEKARGNRKLGTTLRGIGPAYEDKAGRRGLRMADLMRPAALPTELEGFGQRLRPRIADTSAVLHREMARGYSVLFEGAQATLLDVDHGTYPFVTSSCATAGGALSGLGVPPTRLDGMLGIAKAYTTRVGAGPLPSEIGGDLEQAIREKGHEYGASTGRPRLCGWFDAVVVRYSVRVNGFDTLALTKLDVLDEQAEVKICTAYRRDSGETLTEFPADLSLLEGSEAVYETVPGWQTSTAGVRDFSMLPAAAQRYVARLSE